MHRIPPEIENYWTEIYGGNFWNSGKDAVWDGSGTGTLRLLASTYRVYRKASYLPLVIEVVSDTDWVYKLEGKWYSEPYMLRALKLLAFL